MTDSRASDAERDAVFGRLADAMRDGRLDLAEYERRSAAIPEAVTTKELDALHADLPESSGERARADRAAWRAEWSYFAGGAVVMTGIWGITCLAGWELKFFWPMIPLAVWGLILVTYIFWPERKAQPVSRSR